MMLMLMIPEIIHVKFGMKPVNKQPASKSLLKVFSLTFFEPKSVIYKVALFLEKKGRPKRSRPAVKDDGKKTEEELRKEKRKSDAEKTKPPAVAGKQSTHSLQKKTSFVFFFSTKY